MFIRDIGLVLGWEEVVDDGWWWVERKDDVLGKVICSGMLGKCWVGVEDDCVCWVMGVFDVIDKGSLKGVV